MKRQKIERALDRKGHVLTSFSTLRNRAGLSEMGKMSSWQTLGRRKSRSESGDMDQRSEIILKLDRLVQENPYGLCQPARD